MRNRIGDGGKGNSGIRINLLKLTTYVSEFAFCANIQTSRKVIFDDVNFFFFDRARHNRSYMRHIIVASGSVKEGEERLSREFENDMRSTA